MAALSLLKSKFFKNEGNGQYPLNSRSLQKPAFHLPLEIDEWRIFHERSPFQK